MYERDKIFVRIISEYLRVYRQTKKGERIELFIGKKPLGVLHLHLQRTPAPAGQVPGGASVRFRVRFVRANVDYNISF